MKGFILAFISSVSLAFGQGLQGGIDTEVQQGGLDGNALGATLGSPFGQSFTAVSTHGLFGVVLAMGTEVDARDLTVSLFRTDPTGNSITGPALASGSITAAQILSFDIPQPSTPLYFPVFFDQPYTQTAGERLAFTIQGGDEAHFYFGSRTPYTGGRILGDGTRDLVFGTIVPEPATAALAALGVIIVAMSARKKLTP